MQISDERKLGDWWAKGDMPVRTDSRVNYLVDGRTAILTMCIHFLKARKYIYLANWGMTPGMELVRGTDHRAGPDGSNASPQRSCRSYPTRTPSGGRCEQARYAVPKSATTRRFQG